MDENHDSDELIEQYLLGKLDGVLLNEFKERLAADEKFRGEVALHSTIIRNIKAAGRKEWALKLDNIHYNSNLEDDKPGQQQTTGKKLAPVKTYFQKKYLLAAAASVIILIFSALFIIKTNKKTNAEQIFIAYYQPYPDLQPGTRSLTNGLPETRKKAFEAYNAGNYLESIRLFKSIPEKENDELILFYLGNAYLSAGKQTEAETCFKNYLSRYQEFTVESKWYLSLSYLKQDKVNEAKKLLEELQYGNNHYSKKAREILDKF